MNTLDEIESAARKCLASGSCYHSALAEHAQTLALVARIRELERGIAFAIDALKNLSAARPTFPRNTETTL